MRAFRHFPPTAQAATRIAREGKLSGMVFVAEIWRWEGETQKFVRALVDFKLMRIDDGAVVWERRVQGAIPTPSATNVGQASTDAIKAIVQRTVRGMKRGVTSAVWFYSLASVILVSLLSLVGLAFISVAEEKLKRIIFCHGQSGRRRFVRRRFHSPVAGDLCKIGNKLKRSA